MVKKLQSDNQEVDTLKQHDQGAYEALLNNLDGRLEAARPRLVCYARKRGVTPDAVDDVVQETLLEAWNSFSRLYTPERFDAWLNGICRNLCLRWVETHSQNLRRQETGLFQEADDPEASLLENIVDPLALDPAELLSHQELATLLAQALGYLPETTRSTLELCYLEELSQSEAASQLGLSTNTLGVRLHRARRQLRQILNTKLRAEAQEFGLALDEDVMGTWRETRIWCMFCSRCHMQGLFEPFPDGRVNLRLRCPICSPNFGSPEHDYALTYSGRMLELQRLRSFRPAFNRVTQVADTYWRSMHQLKKCYYCGTRVEPQLLGPGERIPPLPYWPGWMSVVYCPACVGYSSVYAGWHAWWHPAVQDFMAQHPRWISEPETLLEYACQPAICARFVDTRSTAKLIVLIHSQTMEVLNFFKE